MVGVKESRRWGIGRERYIFLANRGLGNIKASGVWVLKCIWAHFERHRMPVMHLKALSRYRVMAWHDVMHSNTYFLQSYHLLITSQCLISFAVLYVLMSRN